MTRVERWPLFGLEVKTPRLTLRVARDSDLDALLEVVDSGVHPPEVMPFMVPWTDAQPPERDLNCLKYWWSTRSNWSTDAWQLEFLVLDGDQPIGVQGITGRDFVKLHTLETGSWLGQRFQGRGFGIEMRTAVLWFGFEVLGAQTMTSGAFADNTSSRRVSEKLGYEPNGTEVKAPRGEARDVVRYRLTRDRWNEVRRPLDVAVSGWEDCRSMFGR
jgi:RimJ/RimL family protein N-acetyltransferase